MKAHIEINTYKDTNRRFAHIHIVLVGESTMVQHNWVYGYDYIGTANTHRLVKRS